MTALIDTVPTETAKDGKAKTGIAGSLSMRYCLDCYCYPPCLPGVWRPCGCGAWIGSIGYQPGGYDKAKPVVCYGCAKKGLN